ncbi:nicotinate-nucleotide--dimethylbenzimidazole phosphoribosyltransferase [Anaerostipes sp.]|uniref:nicotinate-nucleotide--dimethylbenzimidazole phosphoribosyltransferase n=1 Tax=Anaerostipes sp. TaxID=1872530 RepID=UPI0025C374CF|nr:nicotinate-nucleotide--dimethylbenzimidazole phosphoribosyltransferase [Anaerostipes sp.]MBS7007392.1 nicotinate-nucleotide--dimethylbenzimidazole phosphoribosyltransferase [Anaerostipes sp.]
MDIRELCGKITLPDETAMEQCRKRWNNIAKPLNSLGKLEDLTVKLAGITGEKNLNLSKKALVCMCADNGVVEEGISQSGQDVTAVVSENLLRGKATSSVMCRHLGVDLFAVDVGIACETQLIQKKTAYGTRNMAKEPAMTKEETLSAVNAGISMAYDLHSKGYRIAATGEMGIGNTTTSSAAASVLLDRPAGEMTGRGAGLDSDGLCRKIRVIEQAVRLHKPDKQDPLDVLSKVGGFDLAALTGLFLGGAAAKLPIVMDGFISGTAALAAVRICPDTVHYILPSHRSKEPAAGILLDALGLEPCLDCSMSLGEGTGALALFPLLDLALAVYHEMSTFEEVDIEQYVPLV